jgi:hypothetical protein
MATQYMSESNNDLKYVYTPVYFNTKDIGQIKFELSSLFPGYVILIHHNKITIVADYDENNQDKYVYPKPSNNESNNETNIFNEKDIYNDELSFSPYDSSSLFFMNFEEIQISIKVKNDRILCSCKKTEVDDKSFMFDQLAHGVITCLMNNNSIEYYDGECMDKNGDCYGIRPQRLIEILNVLSKYWKTKY